MRRGLRGSHRRGGRTPLRSSDAARLAVAKSPPRARAASLPPAGAFRSVPGAPRAHLCIAG
eukprot:2352913-Prymnesium_polylepis.1